MDVKIKFLNGELDNELHMEQQALKSKEIEYNVCHLNVPSIISRKHLGIENIVSIRFELMEGPLHASRKIMIALSFFPYALMTSC